MLLAIALVMSHAPPNWQRVATDGANEIDVDIEMISGDRRHRIVWVRTLNKADGSSKYARAWIDCEAATVTPTDAVLFEPDGRRTTQPLSAALVKTTSYADDVDRKLIDATVCPAR